MDYDPFVCGVTIFDIVECYGKSTAKILRYSAGWGFLAGMVADDDIAAVQAMIRPSLHFVQPLFDVAASMLDRLGSFHAVHLRFGDRPGLPLVECRAEAGWEPVDRLESFAVSWREAWLSRGCKSREGVVTAQDAVLAAGYLPGSVVYIATNIPSDAAVKAIRAALAERGVRSLIFAEVALETEIYRAAGEGRGMNGFSAVEQIICAYAETFLPSWPSSWDEEVTESGRRLSEVGS